MRNERKFVFCLGLMLVFFATVRSAIAQQVTLSLPASVTVTRGKEMYVPIKIVFPNVANLAAFQVKVTIQQNVASTLQLETPLIGVAGSSVEKVVNCSPINNTCYVSGVNPTTGLNANAFNISGNAIYIILAVGQYFTGGNLSISSPVASSVAGTPINIIGNATCNLTL